MQQRDTKNKYKNNLDVLVPDAVREEPQISAGEPAPQQQQWLAINEVQMQ